MSTPLLLVLLLLSLHFARVLRLLRPICVLFVRTSSFTLSYVGGTHGVSISTCACVHCVHGEWSCPGQLSRVRSPSLSLCLVSCFQAIVWIFFAVSLSVSLLIIPLFRRDVVLCSVSWKSKFVSTFSSFPLSDPLYPRGGSFSTAALVLPLIFHFFSCVVPVASPSPHLSHIPFSPSHLPSLHCVFHIGYCTPIDRVLLFSLIIRLLISERFAPSIPLLPHIHILY